VIVGQAGKPHQNNVWVKGAYLVKQQAAKALAYRSKVLVVGGSASLFGVDSEIMETLTGLPTVNFGVNAGIGTYALPALADPLIKPGDVVLMPLEYRLLLWDGQPSYVTLSWALEHPKSIARWQPISWLHGFWTLPLRRVYEGYLGIPENYVNSGPYGPHRLNSMGDQLLSAKADQSAAQLSHIQNIAAETYNKRLHDTTLGLTEWAHWWERWQARGACILVVPPPFMEHPDYARPEWLSFFESVPKRVAAAGGDYAGQPLETLFPASAMFDTNYHLVSEARTQYTVWLANLALWHKPECF
jgi:hypothetical protein